MQSNEPNSLDRMQCMEVWGGNSSVDRNFATPGLQIWLHSRPYEQSQGGGDVYYASSCASGRITRLLLADVSGHGAAVTGVAGVLRDLMRQNINVINQTRFVREMNQQFAGQPSLEEFATALVCTFFAPTQTLQFCNAGHPAPMLFRSNERKWSCAEELASVERGAGLIDTPLGAVQGADYSRFEVKLAEGDMMLCVSDAFTESVNREGQMVGSHGLRQIVEELVAIEPAEIIPQVCERLMSENSDNLSQDDATALLFRADGSHASLKNSLLAPFRLFGPVRDATRVEV